MGKPKSGVKIPTKKEKRITKLRRERDRLWRSFCKMPRRDSFSGLHVADEVERVQQELDKLEGKNKSKRYYPELSIELF